MWLRLIVVVVLLAGGFGAGWAVQGWRLGGQLAALRATHAEELVAAQAAGARRAQAEREAADDARAGLDAALAEVARRDREIGRLRSDLGGRDGDARRLREQLAAAAGRAEAACPGGDGGPGIRVAAGGVELLAEGAELVEEGRRLLQQCAAEHDAAAAAVRALRRQIVGAGG